MYQMEEISPSSFVNLNRPILKSEVIEQPTPISLAQVITVPQPLLTNTPPLTIKRAKRVGILELFSFCII